MLEAWLHHNICVPCPVELNLMWPINVEISCNDISFNFSYVMLYGSSGLKVACWPLVPKFAGSNPPETVGFLGRKNPQNAFLRRGSKAGSRNLGKITTGHLSRPQFHLSLLGSLMSLRTQRHVVAKVGTSKGGEKQWQTIPKNLPRM